MRTERSLPCTSGRLFVAGTVGDGYGYFFVLCHNSVASLIYCSKKLFVWEAVMFVYSLRASTIKLVGVICVALTVLITLIAFVPTYSVPASPAADADLSGFRDFIFLDTPSDFHIEAIRGRQVFVNREICGYKMPAEFHSEHPHRPQSYSFSPRHRCRDSHNMTDIFYYLRLCIPL